MDIRNATGSHVTYIVSIFNGALFTNFYVLFKLEHHIYIYYFALLEEKSNLWDNKNKCLFNTN